MKVSYKILKKYLPYIENAQTVAQNLIMHTAEVEEIHSEKQAFENIVIGIIHTIETHENADSLRVCGVDIGENEHIQIVCGGSNLFVGQKVAVAKLGASVVWHGEGEPVIMKKTSIRGVESFGMICASEEIGLKDIFPSNSEKEILDLSSFQDLPGTNIGDILGYNDEILEIDNKAINHRPDLFSYIGIIREIATIAHKKTDLNYEKTTFDTLTQSNIKNTIPDVVKRYHTLEISGVQNTPSSEEITTILKAAGQKSKGLLIDVSNYSLYFYGQPAHIFDADTIRGSVTVRFAHDGESFEALNDITYTLTSHDIVIADDEKILALGGIIGGKSSSVNDSTTHILIETAHFDQAILRATGKRLGLRTDSLNVFEKDILPDTCEYALALIVKELYKANPEMKLISSFDSYPIPQKQYTQPFDIQFYQNLLGHEYDENYVLNILENLGIKKENNTLIIPFWRKELTTKADIAEEIARIDGYEKILPTIPRINIGAVIQDNIYTLKKDTRQYFTTKGFFDVYNYSFVNIGLMEKLNMNTSNLVSLKNYLSEDATHMRNSLIPNLMKGLEENIRDKKDLKLVECEKVFSLNNNNVSETFHISGVITSQKDIVYYDIQNIVSDFLKTLFIDNFYFDNTNSFPEYAHAGRVAKIVIRGKEVGFVGEIHPTISQRFDISLRVGFFEIDVSKIIDSIYGKVKAKELSTFQENNFDLSFVVDKNIIGREIQQTILSVDKKIIKQVSLIDIYENEEKLPGKRSLSFKIFIQSMTETITDETKGNLIKEIIEKVEKKGGKLR